MREQLNQERDDVQQVSVGLVQEWVDTGGAAKQEKSSCRPENDEEDTARKKKKYCYKIIIYKATSSQEFLYMS